MDALFGNYAPEDLSGFSVRAIKFARARLAVLKSFIYELTEKNYEDIRIKDLCRDAEISEPSFYNYFPRKDDLFLYFISLWSVDVQLHCREIKQGTETIRELYRYTAANSAKNPGLIKEIIAYQARTNTAQSKEKVTAVTLAEKSILFGNVPGLAEIPDQGLGPVLIQNLTHAVDSGELPESVSPQIYALILASLFFGVPVITIHNEPEKLAGYYDLAVNQILSTAKLQKGKHRRRTK